MERLYLDTNVLFPMTLMDLLLTRDVLARIETVLERRVADRHERPRG